MAWYNEPKATFGQFLAWLERAESAKNKRKAVALFQGIVYIGGRELVSGTGSYNAIDKHPLGANSDNEKLALTMEICIQAGTGEEPALSEGKLTRSMALGRYITANAVKTAVTPKPPRRFVELDRSAENFLRAAQQAQDAGYNLRAIQAELAIYAKWVKPHIQRWFDVWNVMRSETVSEVARTTLTDIRSHQKMKLVGGSFGRGKHTEGQFVLLTRAIDGEPVILISSGFSKAVAIKYVNSAIGNGSVVNRTLEGTFTQVPKTRSFVFNFTRGKSAGDMVWFQGLPTGKQRDVLIAALRAVGVFNATEAVFDEKIQINFA